MFLWERFDHGDVMAFFSYARGFKGVADVFMRDPELYEPMIEFISRVMTRESDVSVVEREMIAAYVSERNGCKFCIGVHRETLHSLGVEDEVIDAIPTGSAAPEFDTRQRSAFAFVDVLVDRPQALSQADVDRAVAAGWSEQAVEDIVNVVGVFSYVNRLIDAFGVQGQPAYYEYVGGMLAASGYSPLVDMVRAQAVRRSLQT